MKLIQRPCVTFQPPFPDESGLDFIVTDAISRRPVTMSIQALKLGSVALLAFASVGVASAADQRMPVKSPVAAPVAFGWTGCYVGGYAGGASHDRDPLFTDLGNANFRAYSGGITAGRVEDRHSWGIDLDTSF